MKDKKKSHRQTLRRKYNVEAKVREHHRRLRKVARSSDFKKKFKRKDPGIPNNWPLKQELLESIVQAKKQQLEERQQRQELLRQQRKAERALTQDEQAVPELVSAEQTERDLELLAAERQRRQEQKALENRILSSLVASAEAAAARFEANQRSQLNPSAVGGKAIRAARSFARMLRDVIIKADLLLQVVDARDPEGCRSRVLEEMARTEGKRLIIILNKVDLVPKSVTEKWLFHLRKSFPTVPFKCALSTKTSKPISQSSTSFAAISEKEYKSGSTVFGTPELLNIVKNYAKSEGDHLTMGVVGAPNVGKSSVINSLCRSNVATKVGGEAGVTRVLQEVVVDNKLKIIDTPGVLLDGNESEANAVLRNAVKVTQISDPVSVVEELVDRYGSAEVQRLFGVPEFDSATQFISNFGRARGKLGKGGVVDFVTAAQALLYEWSSGKIPHYTLPPEEAIAKSPPVVKFAIPANQPAL